MYQKPKCEMARNRYCNKNFGGYCGADGKQQKECPYLKMVNEITRLSILFSKEDK